jgi:hypothetical protein
VKLTTAIDKFLRLRMRGSMSPFHIRFNISVLSYGRDKFVFNFVERLQVIYLNLLEAHVRVY